MKRIYHILALGALIGLFAMAGFAGFLFATGRLNAERIDQIAMVLRGEFPRPTAPATQPTTQPAMPQPSQAEIERLNAQKEFLELIAERSRIEMEQRRALNQRIQLDVTRDLEEVDARRRQVAEEKMQAVREGLGGQAGFEKELEVFASMEPKKARDLLRQRKDPDVVELFMRMDQMRVRKVVDACKTDEELAWIGRILNQIHNVDSAAANGVDGPNASSR